MLSEYEDNHSERHSKSTLSLTINGEHFEWHSQYITGSEIRKLGSISEDAEIFLKVREPWEDETIINSSTIDLARPGIEHFISSEVEKDIFLIVNGREKKWDKSTITFKDVVELAYGTYIDKPTMVYTIAYEDGPRKNPEGSMVKGSTVFTKNKMIFHATATDKS